MASGSNVLHPLALESVPTPPQPSSPPLCLVVPGAQAVLGMHPTGPVSGPNYVSLPPGACTLPGSLMILSPSPRFSSFSSPTCWEWPGSACLVSLRCPCLCFTTYGQLAKSSGHPRPTARPAWSRSAWISGNTVLPSNAQDDPFSSCA